MLLLGAVKDLRIRQMGCVNVIGAAWTDLVGTMQCCCSLSTQWLAVEDSLCLLHKRSALKVTRQQQATSCAIFYYYLKTALHHGVQVCPLQYVQNAHGLAW